MSEGKFTKGIELIAEERKRQIENEGWNGSHDAGHDLFQLSSAAGCYIANAHNKHFAESQIHIEGDVSRFQIATQGDSRKKWIDGWPWDNTWDKRNKHDVKRSLIIAGALIAAELDRLNAEEAE